MANYCCSARSNYFRVKDMEKFNKWASQFPEIKIYGQEEQNEIRGDRRICLFYEHPDHAAGPA